MAGAGGCPKNIWLEFAPEEIGGGGVSVEAGLGVEEFGIGDVESFAGEFVEEIEFFFCNGAVRVGGVDFGTRGMNTKFDHVVGGGFWGETVDAVFGSFDPDFGVFAGIWDTEVGVGLAVDLNRKVEEFFDPGTDCDDGCIMRILQLVRVFDKLVDAVNLVVEEMFVGFGAEEVSVSPTGDGIVDGDFVGGEFERREYCLSVVEALVGDFVIDEALFEGLKIRVGGVAEGEDACFGEDGGVEGLVEFLPERITLQHDF